MTTTPDLAALRTAAHVRTLWRRMRRLVIADRLAEQVEREA